MFSNPPVRLQPKEYHNIVQNGNNAHSALHVHNINHIQNPYNPHNPQQEAKILNQRVNIPPKHDKGFSYRNIPLPKVLSKASQKSSMEQKSPQK